MARSNLGIGLGERSLSLFPSRPSGGGLGLETRSFSLKTYTADRFAVAEGIGGSGSYIYELPGGVDDNDLFSIEPNTGVLSAPHPILETGVTKDLTIRVSDAATSDVKDIPSTVGVTGTILRWNVTTLSTNPGGLPNWAGDRAANNTPAMDALRTRMLAEQTTDQDVAFEITIPAGEYRYTNPRPFRGLRRYRMIGVGSDQSIGTRFRNVSSSGDWYFAVHWITNFDPYQRSGGSGAAGPEHYGFRIETAAAGSNQITLLEAVSAPQLTGSAAAVGKRLWVASGISASYDGSYPPHARFFEAPRIAAITGTGVGDTITLDRPLKYTHRQDAPEYRSAVQYGRARAVFWDQDYSTRSGEWFPGTECVVIEGINFLPNPHWDTSIGPQSTSEQVHVFGAQYARLEGVAMTSWGPQISEKQVLVNCQWGFSEPDAQLAAVELVNCTVSGEMRGPNAPGIMRATSCMFGDLIGIGCGFWIADGCRFTRWQTGGGQSRIFTMDDIGPTKLMRLTDCIFSSNVGNQSIFSWAAYSAYTVGSGINYASKTFTVPSAGSIWDRLAEIVGDQHLAGRVAYNQSGTWRWGTTTAVYSDGTVAGPLHIDVQWDTGAGGGITNGTVIRFYKMTECDWTNVVLDGWTSVLGAPSVANYDKYVLAGQQIPANIWDVSTA